MKLKVDELAAQCDVTVDTIRYYQTRGLLPSPQKSGRNALYDDAHKARLNQIRDLQDKGLSLRVIGRILDEGLDPADQGLAEAVASARTPIEEAFTRDRLAELSGVPTALLSAVEDAGLTLGREAGGKVVYSMDDVRVVRSGLALLDAGIPLASLLSLATAYDEASRSVAAQAVELFDVYIRKPILEKSSEDSAATTALIDAFNTLLPAVTRLVSHHFQGTLLQAAEERFSNEDQDA